MVRNSTLGTATLLAVFLVIPCQAGDDGSKDDRSWVPGISGGGTNIFDGGGKDFQDNAIPRDAKVAGVRVRAGAGMDAIQLIYKSKDGKTLDLEKHGGNGGDEETFLLDDGEFITGLCGRTGTGVDSIQFITNKRKSKSFGGKGGTDSYNIEVPDNCELCGFAGRSNSVLTRVGMVVRKK